MLQVHFTWSKSWKGKIFREKDFRKSVHQLELEEPNDSASEDTFYVDGVELDDKCVDTINYQA